MDQEDYLEIREQMESRVKLETEAKPGKQGNLVHQDKMDPRGHQDCWDQ